MAKKKKLNQVPMLDLQRHHAPIQEELEQALLRCARSGRYILGPEIEAFETEAAAYCGCAHAIAVSSGTDALLMALLSENVGPGDEVITVPFSFFATAGGIERVGARPVFVDIEPDGFNINTAKIENAVTEKTKAIIPVHLYGQCAEMDIITQIADKHGLAVIEDAAQAIGAEYKQRRAGSMGRYGCFSFFPSKNLGAMGDGGLITTDSSALAEHLRIMRDHGQSPKYQYRFIGGNFRCDEIQAAVLRVKLPKLDAWSEARKANADIYREVFDEMGHPDILCPRVLPQRRHIYNQFTVRIKNGGRDKVLNHLHSKNIGAAVYYPLPLHLQDCFKHLEYKKGDMPVSEAATAEVLSLPVFPELSPDEIEHAAESVIEALILK
jgi:dTDP-4-amino-4,6-dideoxygalactose transaminase